MSRPLDSTYRDCQARSRPPIGQLFKCARCSPDRDDVPVNLNQHDRGTTFVELLVSIVLLGTAVVAILVTLRTSTRATAIDLSQAKAYEWVQSVSDQIYDAPRIPCYSGGSAAAISAYQSAANGAAKPPGWSSGTVTVTNVEFLGRAQTTDQFTWSSAFCFESATTTDPYYTSPLYTQRVTFTVNGPPNTTAVTMQVVKSEK